MEVFLNLITAVFGNEYAMLALGFAAGFSTCEFLHRRFAPDFSDHSGNCGVLRRFGFKPFVSAVVKNRKKVAFISCPHCDKNLKCNLTQNVCVFQKAVKG